MAWSRIILPDGDPLPDEFHTGHVLVLRDGDRVEILCGRELLDFEDPALLAIESALGAGAGAGAPVFRADLDRFADLGEVLACGEGLEIRSLDEAEFKERLDPIGVARTPIGRVGGAPARELALLVDRGRSPRPATRRLIGLPPQRCSGFLPFLSAVGAEPFVVFDEVGPLIDELDRRGPDWVAAVARAGAFLWRLDLRGREGADRIGAQRVDEDVLLPLCAGLDAPAHLAVGGDLGELVLEARRGDFDLAFVFPPLAPATLDDLETAGRAGAFLLAPELPAGLGIR
ncbi:MAG: hypothetical protein H6807_02885 [Planctomycetes bacterium]|nr:hypothetical protein [Planctomycetota bacterium]